MVNDIHPAANGVNGAAGDFPRARRGAALNTVIREGGAKAPVAEMLMAILTDNYTITRVPDGGVAVTCNWSPSVMIPLKGKKGGGLRSRLGADIFALTGRSANSEALASVLNMIEGSGQDRPRQAAFTRTGKADGSMLLDLGRDDGLTVWIQPGRWGVWNRVPVLWRRGAMTSELPVPFAPATGSPRGGRHLFNFTSPGQWVTAVACQVAGLLYPTSTHPVEIYTADSSGALKTATLNNMKRWADPGPNVTVPKDGKDWAVTASNCHRVAIDNVSAIPNWWSDMLCKAASGDSWASRALHTDDEVSAWNFSAVPMLDGIGLVVLRDDLADRAVRHHFRRPEWFLTDEEAESTWYREHPSMLGWLLDTCASVSLLHASGRVSKPRGGRMAQFEWTLAALDALWGSDGAGMSWYKASQAEAASDAVHGDVLALAITESFDKPWHGYPDELMKMIVGKLPMDDEQGKAWTVQKIGVRLPRAASAVTKLGWTMHRTDPDRNRRRSWVICPPKT